MINKRGFTLIEILLVIAVIGVLVLISTSSLFNTFLKAEEAKKKQEAKVLSDSINYNLSLNDNYIEESISNGYLKEVDVSEYLDNLLNIKGEKLEKDSQDSLYKIKYDDSKDVFIYSSKDSNVYYLSKKDIEEKNEREDLIESPEEFFQWIPIPDGYDFPGKEGKGVFLYVGKEKEVVIPQKINGHTLKSYHKMFMQNKSGVTKVSSQSKEVEVFTNMFTNFQSGSQLDLRGLETSGAKDVSGMFVSSILGDLNMEGLNFSNTENMSSMFWGSKINSLNLKDWKTSKVNNMSFMFHGTTGEDLAIDLSSFDTGNLENMESMFMNGVFKSINLKSFDYSKIKDRKNILNFLNATKAENVDISSLTKDKIILNGRFDNIFTGAEILSLKLNSGFTNEDVSLLKEKSSIKNIIK